MCHEVLLGMLTFTVWRNVDCGVLPSEGVLRVNLFHLMICGMLKFTMWINVECGVSSSGVEGNVEFFHLKGTLILVKCEMERCTAWIL